MYKRTRTSNFDGERVQEHYQITKEGNSKCHLIFAEVFGVEEVSLSITLLTFFETWVRCAENLTEKTFKIDL